MTNASVFIIFFGIVSLGLTMRGKDDPFANFHADFERQVQKMKQEQDAFMKNAGSGGMSNFGGGNSKRVQWTQGPDGKMIEEVWVNGKKVNVQDDDLKGINDGKIANMMSPTLMGKAHVHRYEDMSINPNKILVDIMGCKPAKQNPQKETTTPQPTGGKQAVVENTPNGMKDIAKKVVELLKAYRKKSGQKLLEWDEDCYKACISHTQKMANTRTLSHNGFSDRVNALPYDSDSSAENVAMFGMSLSDSDQIAAQFMDQWKKSPGHNANMLKPEVTRCGVVVVNSGGSYYATMLLVRRK